jgi:hypothetical protein
MRAASDATITVNQRRSERVMLRIRIMVSKDAMDGQILREEAFTKVVNAHGGLLTTQMEVTAGENVVLTNPKTNVSQQCYVLRCEPANPGDYSVSFEFSEPCPNFWPVVFPPENWHAPEL